MAFLIADPTIVNSFIKGVVQRAEAAGAVLIGNVPTIADTVASRLGLSLSGLDYKLSQIVLAADQQRLSILMGAIKDLLGLLNQVELAQLDNEIKLELLRIQGEIQKSIALLRGQFQVELANLKGQQDIELANFEAAVEMDTAIALVPIERQGKIDIAIAKGEGAQQEALVEKELGIQLSRIAGENQVKLSELEADVTRAEGETQRESIITASVVEAGGIMREALIDVRYILETAALEKGFKLSSSAVEAGYIIGSNSIEVGSIQTQAALEVASISGMSNIETASIIQVSAANIAAESAVFSVEDASRRTVADVTAQLEAESILGLAVAGAGFAIQEAGLQSALLIQKAQGEAAATLQEAAAKSIQGLVIATAEGAFQIDRSRIEAFYTLQNAMLEGSSIIHLANIKAANEGVVFAAESAGALDVATEEANSTLNRYALEGEFALEEATAEAGFRVSIASLELQQQAVIDNARIVSRQQEAQAQVASDRTLSVARITNIGREAAIKLGYIANESNIQISQDDLQYLNQMLSAQDKKNIQIKQLEAIASLKQIQYGREAAYSKAFIKQSAEASYNSTIQVADSFFTTGIQIVLEQVELAQRLSTFAIECDNKILENARSAAASIGASGAMRQSDRYILKRSSASGVTITNAPTPTFIEQQTEIFEVPSTAPPIIDSEPSITIDETITFE